MKNFFKTLFAIGSLYAFYQGGYMVGCCSTINALNGIVELNEAIDRAEGAFKTEEEAE